MLDWIKDHEGLLWGVGIASLAVIAASLMIIPAMVVRIPADYFTHRARPRERADGRRPAVRLAVRIGKNILGVVLMLAGIAMFILPGQGVLTLLVGFFLIDFPGKYKLEKWLVARPWVHRPINWLRRRRGREPLKTEAGADETPRRAGLARRGLSS